MALSSTTHLVSFTGTTQKSNSIYIRAQTSCTLHTYQEVSHSTSFIYTITQTNTNLSVGAIDHSNFCFPDQIRINTITLDIHLGFNNQFDPHSRGLQPKCITQPDTTLRLGEYNGTYQEFPTPFLT